MWGVLLGAAVGLAAACAFPLDDEIACGDAYVDRAAGEECDPQDPARGYEQACVGTTRPRGVAACDPSTCTIVNTREQCAVCGDGIVDTDLGEQCDGDNLNGAVCPGGVGTLQCDPQSCQFDTTYCKRCGNGMIDEGEECDVNLDPAVLTQGPPPCTELASPYADGRPYTGGEPSRCLDDCRWDRTGCHYCGNGSLETQDVEVVPELCDGERFDVPALEDLLANSACTSFNSDLRPIVTCASNCTDMVPVIEPEPCCVKAGGMCPAEGVPLRCCSEIYDPAFEGEPCQVVFDSFGNAVEVCR